MSAPLEGTATGRELGPVKVNYTHDAMIDLILAEPGITQQQLAVKMKYTFGWVSRVIGSDAFQARLAYRKADVVDPEIKQNFEDRLKGLANQSLAVIQHKLDATQNADLAIKALDLSTRALGFGARVQNVQQNNFVVALPQKAVSESEWAKDSILEMAGLHAGGANQVMDVQVKQTVVEGGA